jgi:hypothetical protein
MKTYPNQIVERSELNLRNGIKSSLAEIKELFALTFTLYLATNKEVLLNYSKEVNAPNIKIEIKDDLLSKLELFFNGLITDNVDFKNKVNDNPLLTAQMESLQVSLELFWKLCKVDFIQNYPSSQERTGGKRYDKKITFTCNTLLLENCLLENDGSVSDSLKNILYNWIMKSAVFTPDLFLFKKIQTTLTIFSEETQFKIRRDDASELFFQQEGIYEQVVAGNTVIDKDSLEPVGPFRILKSFIKSDLHSYIKEDGSNGLGLKADRTVDELGGYNEMVKTTLNLIPKRTVIYEEKETTEIEETSSQDLNNVIFYGSPGTGKSREVNKSTIGFKRTRITFHPETDYHSFVGSYKPVMEGTNIKYDFVPQAFTKAYCNAWLNPNEPYFLIIEELNRGNCAQIFGDIFQCLDRDSSGQSEYGIDCDKDLAKYLQEKFEKDASPEILENYKNIIESEDFDKIILPSNLYIYATMNTSDQSLFPMDSAFKRRWDMKFVPVDYEDANKLEIVVDKDTIYNWGNFISIINPSIKELTGSEDKQLGNRFINPPDGKITFEQFRSKVLFYLWSEIYKDEVGSLNSIFKYQILEEDPIEFQFGELFEEKEGAISQVDLFKGFMHFNGIESIKNK